MISKEKSLDHWLSAATHPLDPAPPQLKKGFLHISNTDLVYYFYPALMELSTFQANARGLIRTPDACWVHIDLEMQLKERHFCAFPTIEAIPYFASCHEDGGARSLFYQDSGLKLTCEGGGTMVSYNCVPGTVWDV